MALVKQKMLESLVTGEYWVAESRNNKVLDKTEVTMLLFKDATARTNGAKPLYRERVSDVSGTYLSGADLYAKIKVSRIMNGEETNWFHDAVDLA